MKLNKTVKQSLIVLIVISYWFHLMRIHFLFLEMRWSGGVAPTRPHRAASGLCIGSGLFGLRCSQFHYGATSLCYWWTTFENDMRRNIIELRKRTVLLILKRGDLMYVKSKYCVMQIYVNYGPKLYILSKECSWICIYFYENLHI